VKPARVMLLGTRSFIGKALLRALSVERIETLGLSSADVDLTSPTAAEKLARQIQPTDAVVMFAALTPDKGRDAATFIRNIAMMQQVCTALGKTGCAHFVYFSSDAVYGLAPSHVNEQTPAAPQDLYGAMHLARELMAQGLANMPVLVLRPTLVYGIEDSHNAYGPNRFRRAAQKDGRIQLFGEGEEVRDHVHVDDVAALTLRCLRERRSGTLNVATGRSSSFRSVAELVARQFAAPPEICGAPRANPIAHRHYDITNLVRAFPDFRFTALEDGIAHCHRQMTGAA
jgi:UDP-glucose 4-epimerase